MSYRLGIYEKALPNSLSWAQKFDAAKECGYDFIEMSIDETDEKISRLDWTDNEINDFLSLSLQKGIRAESICFSAQRRYPLGSGVKETEKAAIELLEKAIIFANKMGIRIIQAQGYDCYYGETSSAETRERFSKNLKNGAMFAASYGVILGMETMEDDFMNTVQKSMSFVSEADSPYLLAYPDVGNVYNGAGAENVKADLLTGKGRICSAHLKETIPDKFREIPYGTGQVDFPLVIKTLYDMGVRRYVAEFWDTGEENWMETLGYNNKFLRDHFDSVLSLEV